MNSLTFILSIHFTSIHAGDPLSSMIGGAGLAAMGRIGRLAPVAFVSKISPSVMTAMASMSGMPNSQPQPTTFIDPNLLSERDTCERNYRAKCPVGFVLVGNVLGDGARCAADRSKYKGRCMDRPIKFSRLSRRGKIHWSMLCSFQWPCEHCMKNYDDLCPVGWLRDISLGPDATVCAATPSYEGPCKKQEDFGLYNAATKDEWSQECLAYWPCKQR